ncbi:MAG: hypothetical protein M0018_02315 [Nitrospiraceae bacterium]|nr:hypothetical protein [Nitrospiraceae bacterium]
MKQAQDAAQPKSRKTRADKKLFSELDVLLRAVERYFDPENFPDLRFPAGADLPVSPSKTMPQKSGGVLGTPLPGRDFSMELAMARGACLRVIAVLEGLIPESRRNLYWFRKYAEKSLPGVGTGDDFKKWMHLQETPEQCLYLLYDSFQNIKELISGVLESGAVSWPAFAGVGGSISSAIRGNRCLNPFEKEINLEFDVIENARISEAVKKIPDRQQMRIASSVLLGLFRFLRYLSHVDLAARRPAGLYSNYLILLLAKLEIGHFIEFLESSADAGRRAGLSALLGGSAYQFSMERKRVFRQELRDFPALPASRQRGKIENSHGILKNLIEHSVVAIVQHWAPAVKGEEIFDSFMTKREQSMRLREEMALLGRLLALFEKKSGGQRNRAVLLTALKNYMRHFESYTFRLLRYEDYEEFASFFVELSALLGPSPKKGQMLPDRTIPQPAGGFEKLLEKCAHFAVFVDSMLEHINKRAELMAEPMDPARTDRALKKLIRSS